MKMPTHLREPVAAKDVIADTREARDRRRAARAAWSVAHVWHPHQLRHTAATRLRREFGLEAAQVILGHKTLKVTEIYAEKNVEAAQRIMATAG
jgi:integrase